MGRAISQWVYLGGVKAFADGSLGSNSALFYEVRKMILGHFLGIADGFRIYSLPTLDCKSLRFIINIFYTSVLM